MKNYSKRKVRYIALLSEYIVSVDSVRNFMDKIITNKHGISMEIIEDDLCNGLYDLELALASLCIMLRKMDENSFIELPQNIRTDCNSIIHSTRFEIDDDYSIVAFSRKGREVIDINGILEFARKIVD